MRLHEERGATVVLFAVCLVLLMAFIALAVDGGGLLLRRREMVNSSDAGALAAAKSCAIKAGQTNAEVKSDELSDANLPNHLAAQLTGGITQITPNCDAPAGSVSVQYVSQQGLYFAPVLGFNRNSPVTTAATATWGNAGTAPIIPLVIYTGAFQGPCNVPNAVPGTICPIWEDNTTSGTLSGGNFGFLDAGNGWNVPSPPAGGDCNGTGDSTLTGWINSTIQPLPLNYPSATWVCDLTGNHSQQVWDALLAIAHSTNPVRDFPVVGTSPADNQPSFIGNPKPIYNVIGFAQMTILDVQTVKQTNPLPATCAIPQTATSPVNLLTCASVPAGGTYVAGSAKVNPGSFKTWTVNNANGSFAWTGALPKSGISVDFTYTQPTGTTCPGTPPNGSGHCLVLQWNGYTVGGEDPGGGADFGFKAIKLCDKQYGTCLG